MAKLLWALLCEQAIINSQTNNVSLIEIIEQLNVPNFPTIVPQKFYIVSLWEKETPNKDKEETFNFKIIIKSQPDTIDPNESGFSVEATIPNNKDRFRNVCAISGLKIDREGILNIAIFLKSDCTWDEKHRIPIQISKS